MEDTFNLSKYLNEGRINLTPLKSIGAFIDTENGLLYPMKSDNTPDLDSGMAVDIMDADHYEIMDQIDSDDEEIYMSVLKKFQK
jgi:hypothetical protein